LVFVRLLLAQAQAAGKHQISPQIMQRLAQIKERATANGRVQREIAVLILQTLAYNVQQETDAALSTLQQALTLAQPGSYIRLFANEGDMLAHLLLELARTASGAEADTIGNLLQTIKAPPAANNLLVEPLTERELEILRLIVAGLSNQEIADSLVIALSTVKRHINHIYGKLAVNSRSQAIAKTHELHLLPQTTAGRSGCTPKYTPSIHLWLDFVTSANRYAHAINHSSKCRRLENETFNKVKRCGNHYGRIPHAHPYDSDFCQRGHHV